MPKKWLKYISLFAKCYRNQKKCWQLFHLTLVTNGGGRPRWKVVTLSFVFFLTPSLRWSLHHLPTGWRDGLARPTNGEAMAKTFFSLNRPLGRFSHRVKMSVRPSVRPFVCLSVCAKFMLRPLIGPQVTWPDRRPLIGWGKKCSQLNQKRKKKKITPRPLG